MSTTCHNNMPRTIQVCTQRKRKTCAYQKREKLEEIITQLEYSADMLHEDNDRAAEPRQQNVPKDNND